MLEQLGFNPQIRGMCPRPLSHFLKYLRGHVRTDCPGNMFVKFEVRTFNHNYCANLHLIPQKSLVGHVTLAGHAAQPLSKFLRIMFDMYISFCETK